MKVIDGNFDKKKTNFNESMQSLKSSMEEVEAEGRVFEDYIFVGMTTDGCTLYSSNTDHANAVLMSELFKEFIMKQVKGEE